MNDQHAGDVGADLARALSTLDRLVDLEAIKQLKARYFRLIDAKDWAAFRDLFTKDCKHYLPQGSLVACMTNDEYFAMLERSLGQATTVHHGHMPEITFTGDREAEGIWAMQDYVQADNADRRISLKGYGHYFETYRKGEDGQWRISSKRNSRIRVDQLPWISEDDARPT